MSAFGSQAFGSNAFASNAFGGGGGQQDRDRERRRGAQGGRRSDANNAWLRFISNAEIDALQDSPDLLRSLYKEDTEITDFIVSIVTRGLK